MARSNLEKLRDFDLFARNFLSVRPKDGGHLTKLVLNRPQRYIYERLEAQLKTLGRVRAVILKGRQQGASTLIAARFFHKTITNRGTKTFILTHEGKATKSLFDIVKRYHDNLPPGLCPVPDKYNETELKFSVLDSEYAIGTARSGATGRSQTIHLFHGSEVAQWENAEDHELGILECIGDVDGTEIILESTAAGVGNYFHQFWKAAEQGIDNFQAIFVPWYWSDEYSDDSPGFKPTTEEQYLYDTYGKDGLNIKNLAWRRRKIQKYSKNSNEETALAKFNQEYPVTAAVAFRNSIADTFINPMYVMRARNTKVQSDSPLVIGVDPSLGQHDRCALIRRRGLRTFGIETFRNIELMELVGKIRIIIDSERPVKVFIDAIGLGAGVVSRLKEMGYDCVEGINVAREARNKERYVNLRAELWGEARDYLMGALPVEIPDRDDFHADLCCIGAKDRSDNRIQLESKESMKSRGIPSPDLGDAFAYTFYLGPNVGASSYAPVFIPERHQRMFM